MEPTTQDRINTLTKWATSHHAYLHPSVEIYPDPRTGLSFRVKPSSPSPIQPLDPIVRLPTSLTLSYHNAIQPQPTFHRDFIAQTPPRHRPSLPQEEAELLEGTNVDVGIEKIRADVNKEFRQAKELLSLHPKDGADDFGQQLTKTLYQWAYCIFSSRSFRPSLVLSEEQQKTLPDKVGIDDFSVLLPLFDIGNHDMTTEIRWDLSETPAGGHTCDLRINKSHNPGDQIFNNYSMKTNAELLLGYGFMVPVTNDLHNDYTHVRKRSPNGTAAVPGDEYLISRRPINHPSSLLARSKQTLLVKPMPPLPPVLGSFQHVQHDMVWDIFCTLTNPDLRRHLIPVPDNSDPQAAERLRQEKFFSGQVDDECMQHLEQTVAIIQHKVLQELERLNETDVEVLGSDRELLSQNQRLALEYRERCRQVLENTLTAMSEDELLRFDEEE
ncbi:Ribosomal lysine N-methyltransferase set10 [Cladobotryum mycophilum]|uniref:Ribosomal lysine N-methyltransferase set10 n=1 Tax=Cladobotryum mycophilum TaxID=491253 RepID=A0ABR0SCB1_9HYPO